jgi:hypothetical protein
MKKHGESRVGRANGASVRASERPSDRLIVEAKIRSEAPRSLSQEMFGDPPPGYSALDQKKDWPKWY